MRFSYNRCPGCRAMVDDPNEECGLCRKKHPPVSFSNATHAPYASIWARLSGQFWMRIALLSNDLKEGPTRPQHLQ